MDTPIPQPPDALQLIEDLLDPSADLTTIARARRMSLADLLTLIQSPPIQAELEALRRLAEARAHLIQIVAPSTALATLLDACTNQGPSATARAAATRAAHTLLRTTPLLTPPVRQPQTPRLVPREPEPFRRALALTEHLDPPMHRLLAWPIPPLRTRRHHRAPAPLLHARRPGNPHAPLNPRPP